MTMRYAHLCPAHKAAAVAKLAQRNVAPELTPAEKVPASH
jgi:hypothetical protein